MSTKKEFPKNATPMKCKSFFFFFVCCPACVVQSWIIEISAHGSKTSNSHTNEIAGSDGAVRGKHLIPTPSRT